MTNYILLVTKKEEIFTLKNNYSNNYCSFRKKSDETFSNF